jgi:carbonic anhydrase
VTATPTTLSLRHLRDDGWLAEKVERPYNQFTKRTNDLFGFIDILAVRGDETLAVQTTSVDHVSHRVTKIADSPNVAAVREAGWRIVVHGWVKKQGRWVLAREVDVS